MHKTRQCKNMFSNKIGLSIIKIFLLEKVFENIRKYKITERPPLLIFGGLFFYAFLLIILWKFQCGKADTIYTHFFGLFST